jgi:inorganic pyrophosphatase
MRVLIENEAGSSIKRSYDERTLMLLGSAPVSAPYPYPYGFAIGTKSGDGDAVDCFVLTADPLVSGSVVECEPLALLEQIEDGETDHKVLAAPAGSATAVDSVAVERIAAFIARVFAHVPGKTVRVGRLLDRHAAVQFLQRCRIDLG